jgi:hypothetical protein
MASLRASRRFASSYNIPLAKHVAMVLRPASYNKRSALVSYLALIFGSIYALMDYMRQPAKYNKKLGRAALFYVAFLSCICILACLGLGYNLRVIKPYLRWRQTTRDEETQQWEKIDLERNEHNMMGSALMTEKVVGDVQHVEEKFKVGKECATMGTYQGNSNANEVIGKSDVGNAEWKGIQHSCRPLVGTQLWWEQYVKESQSQVT